MKSVQVTVPLSHLIPGKTNPRRVKPDREAHHRLVALIRSLGLLQPLVIRAAEDKPKHFTVIAGNRRLAALREIYRNDGDPKIPCILRDVDPAAADALSLGENFGREAMHPLDEAEAFAKLANDEAKGVEAIAADFGVSQQYVKQRMRLADLADPVKKAYRANEIDTSIAQAFAAVPQERQREVWKELNGQPHNANHVRTIIANDWIDARYALFDLSVLPTSTVTSDLFSDEVFVERQAFMEAQMIALAGERTKLVEEGWSQVIAGPYEDVREQVSAMDRLEGEFDEATKKRLGKLLQKREALESKSNEIAEGDEKGMSALNRKYDALESEIQDIQKSAPIFFSEESKAVATAFLILHPGGQVQRDYRILRRRQTSAKGNTEGSGNGSGSPSQPAPPTSDDLADTQLSVTFTHQALAVRQALLTNAAALKRVLALILHEKIRSQALSIHHDANGVSRDASREGFVSPALDHLRKERAKLDPFAETPPVEDCEGYQKLSQLSAAKLNDLIDLLVVECITAHPLRQTELVHHLASELKVNVRNCWRPDAKWLAGFQKIQLAHLIVELKGPVNAPSPERKKSELVEMLAKLFADAADSKLEDKKLAAKVNGWLPSNLRDDVESKKG